MQKTIIFDTSIPNKPFQIRTPRDSEIQDCINTAIRENCRVELRWTLADQLAATYVFEDSTIEQIRDKIDGDSFAAAKVYLTAYITEQNKKKK